jgi:hypothetical protein
MKRFSSNINPMKITKHIKYKAYYIQASVLLLILLVLTASGICYAENPEKENVSPGGTGPYILNISLTPPGYNPPLCPDPWRDPFREKEPVPLFSPAARLLIDAQEITSNGGVTTALGDVVIRYGDIKITADSVRYDRNTGEITASGAVVLRRGRDFIAGSSMSYNLVTREAYVTNAYGIARDILAPEGSERSAGTVSFWGEEVRWGETLYIRQGIITSCDRPLEQTHYRITGSEIVVEPERHIRIHEARLFINQRQLVGLRSINLPLRHRTRIQPFFLPTIGTNRLEGFYIKESYPYLLGDRGYGTLFLDWYRRAGFGGGVEHYYHFGRTGAGKVYYYTMGASEADVNRYSFSNSMYYLFPNNLFVSANYTSERFSYPGLISPHIKNVELFASHFSDRSATNFLVKNYIYGERRSLNLNLANRYHFNDRLRGDFIMDYLTTEELAGAINRFYRLNTLARLHQQGDVFDTTLEFDYTTGSRSFYVNRIPEVTLRSHSFGMGPFDGRVSLSAGNFLEMPSGIRALRSDMKFSLLNKVFPLGDSGKFSVAGGARQFIYGTGDRKYLLRSRLALEQNVGRNFSVVMSHNFQDTKGYSPLAFDYFDKYQVVASTLAYQSGETFRAQVTGGYDMNRKLYQTIIPQIELCPSRDFSLLLASTYDRNNRLWMNAVGELGVRLTPWVAVKYWGLYDFVNKKFSYQNYVLEFESHDFLTRLVYKSQQGELWFDFNLKLFPIREIETGPNRQRSIINKTLFDGAPREPDEDLL